MGWRGIGVTARPTVRSTPSMRIHALLLGAALAALPAAAQTPTRAEDAAGGVLTRAPELIAFVPAEYPPDAEAAGIEGSVELAIVIDEHGEVQQGDGPRTSPGVCARGAARGAAVQVPPAEIDGAPAPVEITYRYDFVLRRAPPPAAPTEAPVVPAAPSSAGRARRSRAPRSTSVASRPRRTRTGASRCAASPPARRRCTSSRRARAAHPGRDDRGGKRRGRVPPLAAELRSVRVRGAASGRVAR